MDKKHTGFKRVLCVCLTLLMLVSLLPVSALAAEVPASGNGTYAGTATTIYKYTKVDNDAILTVGTHYLAPTDNAYEENKFYDDGLAYDTSTHAGTWNDGTLTLTSGGSAYNVYTRETYTLSSISAVATDTAEVAGNNKDSNWAVGETVTRGNITAVGTYKSASDSINVTLTGYTLKNGGSDVTGDAGVTLTDDHFTGSASGSSEPTTKITVMMGEVSAYLQLTQQDEPRDGTESVKPGTVEPVPPAAGYPDVGDAAIFKDAVRVATPTYSNTYKSAYDYWDTATDGHFRDYYKSSGAGTTYWWGNYARQVDYAVSYQPYNTFTGNNGEVLTNKAANVNRQYIADTENWLVGSNNGALTGTPGTGVSGITYTNDTGWNEKHDANSTDCVLGKQIIHEAGYYTYYVRVLYGYWYYYNSSWHWHSWYQYHQFSIELRQADLDATSDIKTDPTDTVYGMTASDKAAALETQESAVTKVQNHHYTVDVLGQGKESVLVEYVYSASTNNTESATTFSKMETWGNSEQVTVDKTNYQIKDI